jgi:hypothetical protein
MMMIRTPRIIYLLYYLKGLDKDKYRRFLKHAASVTGRSRRSIRQDMLASVIRYNISILDYFYFGFYEKTKSERSKWAGTGYLYEYQLKMNPRDARKLLEDKIRFLRHFSPFINRQYSDIRTLRSDPDLLEKLCTNHSGRLVLKGSHGQVGAEVEVVSCKEFTPSGLIGYMGKNHYDLAEEYVVQHPAIMELSSSGLNTVRIFTQLIDGEIHFLGARFRISVNSPVDNMGAGNLAAPVDLEKGLVTGPGVYSDITRGDEEVHPLTGKQINGFQLPYWSEVIDLARRAALHTPGNRSVGWDIAITESGPELIEGNHNWCKLLWQLPVKEGLKSELEQYH